MIIKQPMKRIEDLDWATLECPCGNKQDGRHGLEAWNDFIKRHQEHTNGELRSEPTEAAERWGAMSYTSPL
jgi:hypothetical protein